LLQAEPQVDHVACSSGPERREADDAARFPRRGSGRARLA
jgi:hypothetical protein